ncbi:MAG: peptide-methionine (S)-S-oxide reductase, partial [Cellulosimicrobium funkei]
MNSIFDAIFGSSGKTTMIAPEDALPGRQSPVLQAPRPHTVLGTSITGPWPEGTRVLYLAMGCFWGAEEIFWQVPGVVSTAVGYMGGTTPNPTYEEACTARTGHTETALVA